MRLHFSLGQFSFALSTVQNAALKWARGNNWFFETHRSRHRSRGWKLVFQKHLHLGKGKGTRYLTSEVPLLSREYSPRKPTVRSFYPALSISDPF